MTRLYKVVILGCENSHANGFLNFIYGARETTQGGFYAISGEPLVKDVEVVGVYSDERAAAEELNKVFGVYIMESYDEMVGKVDGVIITARNGDNHYKYAKPYIASGVPMFIDKPITNTEEEAREFYSVLKQNNIKISGGSTCGFFETVKKLNKMVNTKELGDIYGGFVRAPVSTENAYGGFYFYSQHLVQMMGEIFGYYPESVTAVKHENHYNCMFNYDTFSVNGTYIEGNYRYYAGIDCADGCIVEPCDNSPNNMVEEFMNYYNLLKGGEMHQTYEDFFAPVFILNALKRSYENKTTEKVNKL